MINKRKFGAFRSEMHQLLCNPWLYVAMALILGVLIRDSYNPLLKTYRGEYPRMYDSPYRYSVTMMFGMLVLLAPMINALPYAASYVNDLNSGMLRIRITRCKRLKEYVFAKFGTTFISGALSMIVPIGIYIIIVVSICGEYRFSEEMKSPLEAGIFAPLLSFGGGVTFFIAQLIMVGMFGGIWSCVGLTVSAWIANKYVAMTSPFILYYFFMWTAQMLEIRLLDPSELIYLTPAFQLTPYMGILMITAVPIIEIIVLYTLFYNGVRRRLISARI